MIGLAAYVRFVFAHGRFLGFQKRVLMIRDENFSIFEYPEMARREMQGSRREYYLHPDEGRRPMSEVSLRGVGLSPTLHEPTLRQTGFQY